MTVEAPEEKRARPMILENAKIEDLEAFDADVCVIGGGPVGICLALALEERGRRVLLLESGGIAPDPEVQALSEGEVVDPETHHAPEITTARRLGGAGNLWGGRCLPYDPIDFAHRPWMEAPSWPIGITALTPYLERACALLGAGEPVFSAPLPDRAVPDGEFTLDRLERWSDQPRTHELHAGRLRASPTIAIALRVTVIGFDWSGTAPEDRVVGLRLRSETHGAMRLAARGEVVLAAGRE